MKLEYKTQYLSIGQFDPIDVPDFIVLTGVNGSGKSHLLEAIELGNVSILGLQPSNIVRFTNETFRLGKEPISNANQLSSERDAVWKFHEKTSQESIRAIRLRLGERYLAIKQECEDQGVNLMDHPSEDLNEYRQRLVIISTSPKQQPVNAGRALFAIAYRIPYSIDEISYQTFCDLYQPTHLKDEFLPSQLGKIFWNYFTKYRTNQMNQYQNDTFGKNYPVQSESDFFAMHGEKPWEVVNTILSKFETLKYKIEFDESANFFGNYQLKLVHIENTDLEVDFDKLSSGEKILMALMATIYKDSSHSHFPDAILLDEIDASLHPAMIKNMLNVIDSIFLKKKKKVILVTHSPTTIALSPDSSIYVMNISGTKRIEKRSRRDALRILTDGFVTLAGC